MDGKKSNLGYGIRRTPVPINTGYAKAIEHWDHRTSLNEKNTTFWRRLALCQLPVIALLGAGLVWAASYRQVEMYVVEVDPAEARVVGFEAGDGRWTPDNNAKGYFVAETVRKSRGVILDRVAQSKRVDEALSVVAGPAEARLREYLAEQRELGTAGKQAREVAINQVLQEADDRYLVRWTETTYVNGRVSETENYSGVFKTTVRPPQDKRAILTNPLGMYVTDITWGRDYDAGDVVEVSRAE